MNPTRTDYLHALGIMPWQSNKAGQPSATTPFLQKNEGSELLIVVQGPEMDKGRERQLLAAMLQVIGLSLDTVTLIQGAKATLDLAQQIKLKSPKAVLAFTEDKISLEQSIDIPTITTFHPLHLLKNPLDKRQAYWDLREVKELLQSH